MPRALLARAPVSITSLKPSPREGRATLSSARRKVPVSSHTTATLFRGEENSIAKIFIGDAAFGFAQTLDLNPAEFLTRPATRGPGPSTFPEPFLRPLDYRHARRLQILLQPCGHDL